MNTLVRSFCILGALVGLVPLRVADVTLRRAALEVGGVTVEAQTDPLRSPARTGASQYVSDSLVARLPTLARNFTDFVETTPQIARTSAAGQNNRFNNIQIDVAR